MYLRLVLLAGLLSTLPNHSSACRSKPRIVVISKMSETTTTTPSTRRVFGKRADATESTRTTTELLATDYSSQALSTEETPSPLTPSRPFRSRSTASSTLVRSTPNVQYRTRKQRTTPSTVAPAVTVWETAGWTLPQGPHAVQCGRIPNYNDFIAKDGIRSAKPGEIPWQVRFSVDYFDPPSRMFRRRNCGGVLVVDNQTVLSAASCFNNADIHRTTAYLGSILGPWAEGDRKVAVAKVQRIVVHDRYKAGSSEYDLAMIRITPVAFSNYVLPICLPARCLQAGDLSVSCFSSGWRTNRTNPILGKFFGSKTLQKGSSKQLDGLACRNALALHGQNLTVRKTQSQFLCATSVDENRCQADTGGPLACRNRVTGRYQLEGVLSTHFACDNSRLQVDLYVRPCRLKRFVSQVIGDTSKPDDRSG